MKQQKTAIFGTLTLLAVAKPMMGMEEDIRRWADQRPGLERILSAFPQERRDGEVRALHYGIRAMQQYRHGMGAKDDELLRCFLELCELPGKDLVENCDSQLRVVESVLHRPNGQDYSKTDEEIIAAFGIAYDSMPGEEENLFNLQQIFMIHKACIKEGIRRWRAAS